MIDWEREAHHRWEVNSLMPVKFETMHGSGDASPPNMGGPDVCGGGEGGNWMVAPQRLGGPAERQLSRGAAAHCPCHLVCIVVPAFFLRVGVSGARHHRFYREAGPRQPFSALRLRAPQWCELCPLLGKRRVAKTLVSQRSQRFTRHDRGTPARTVGFGRIIRVKSRLPSVWCVFPRSATERGANNLPEHRTQRIPW